MSSYLDNRIQFIQINNVKNNTSTISQDVPQGSILGQLFYLVFANDLIAHLSAESVRVRVFCYAGNTNILVTADNQLDLKTECESVYQKAMLWTNKNFLKLNNDKTVLLTFTLSKQNTDTKLVIFEGSSNELASQETTKMSGVVIDYKLQWGFHIESLCAKSRSACYGLHFLSEQCSRAIL